MMTNTKKIEQIIEKTLNESSKTIESLADLSNEIDKIVNLHWIVNIIVLWIYCFYYLVPRKCKKYIWIFYTKDFRFSF